ncbi:gliding motility lipoprotein GldB [Flavobacteriales bacterium 34_180_T64]|nr:gliding motility lipoprotein GldB [Flavobacteriales bacterium 34_180_T64]
MKKLATILLICFCLYSCENEDKIEKEISNINIDFTVERFDKAFAKADSNQLPKLKQAFPFLFSKRIPDSIWIDRMNDTLQHQLSQEVNTAFGELENIEPEIKSLFQHLKYYNKVFEAPRVITLTNFVDYRNKLIVTDTIALIALDNYLGTEHVFYGNIQQYLVQNMKPSQIVVDLASSYAEKYSYQSQRKTLLDEMIYFGKSLYFKDKMIPFKTDAEKIGYAPNEFIFATENEQYIWRYFIEEEMLYSTDNDLPSRFIAPAPFSKFYLELDSDSPGRLGQFIGWKIVRSYMENNDISLMDMLQIDAVEIFNNANYKPEK